MYTDESAKTETAVHEISKTVWNFSVNSASLFISSLQ